MNLHDTYQRNADGALNEGKPCRAMGIDIGTTTVSVVLLDGMSGELLGKSTVVHGADLPGDLPEAHLQDPDKLTTAALQAAEALMEQCGASDCIGLTGQMHGMLYVNGEGQAVSPLYTWRDGRGVLPGNGGSCAEQLRRTGGEASAGFGLTTHFWLQKQGGIPQNAAGMVTISDYLGMRLCGRTVPIIARDMAASWGSFDLRQGDFCREALERCGVDTAYLPEVAWEHGVMGYVAGGCGKGAPVVVSLGDNQASVFGSVRDLCSTVLLNIGTGSQISVGTTGHHDCGGSIELRPCVGGTSLLVGSGLCGGSAYATLERFYREIAGTETPMYGMMEQQARQFLYEYGMEAAWKVRTTFAGTRSDPDARGMVGGNQYGEFPPWRPDPGSSSGNFGRASRDVPSDVRNDRNRGHPIGGIRQRDSEKCTAAGAGRGAVWHGAGGSNLGRGGGLRCSAACAGGLRAAEQYRSCAAADPIRIS